MFKDYKYLPVYVAIALALQANQVMATPSEPLHAVADATQSTVLVKDTVVDDANEPVVGAVVKEQGTQNATVTDVNGHFSLNVTQGATLAVSSIGFEPFVAQAKQNMQIRLKDNSHNLNEIVVVGYGNMRRKDVTSSITTLQAKDLNVGVMTSPAQMLQGRVPGLVISTTGDPNGDASLILRGASTLRTGDAMQPYYIVDGVPGVDLSLVSADDIESIDVLRDATATAIYGSKAANGVIIITTKKGKSGKAHITYHGYAAWQTVAKDLALATADDLRAFAQANDFDLTFDAGANTDWLDEVERTGFSQNHNLQVSGGSEKSNYNVSLNYLDQQGIVRGTEKERFTGRALAQSKVLHDRLTLTLGVNANQTTRHESPTDIRSRDIRGGYVTDAMTYYSPTQPIYNEDGSYFSSTSVTNYYNPVSLINEDTQKTIFRRLQFTGKADLELLKGLTWSADFSYQAKQRTRSVYHSTKSQVVTNNGQATRNTYFGSNKVFETYVNYATDIARYHHIGLMAGYSWEENKSNDGFGVTVKNFYNDAVKYYNLKYANIIDGINDVESGNLSALKMISFYGRVNYSYNSRYNIQATIRRDGSSAFGKNNRWATFPSVSAAWRLSEEPFVKNLGVFDDLKLRAGYGVSGNSLGFNAFTATQTYGVTGWFPYTDAAGTTTQMHTIGATGNSNPDLKWEKTGMFNIGLDFGFLGGRINGTIEYYDKRTSDLIYYYPVSTSRYIYGTMTANVGNISNKGIEFSINAVPVQTKDFTWNTTLNLSHNSNKVTKLSNQAFSVDYISPGESDCSISGNTGVKVQRIMEGCPIGQFYTYEWAGYDDKGVSQFYVHDPETGARTGAVTTQPKETDQTKTGTAQPKLTYGWNNTLSYKQWGLNLFFQGVLGNKIFDAQRAQLNCVSFIPQGKNVLREALTDQRYGDVNAQCPSDRYLESGSYLRLATLTLSYNVGKLSDWVSNITVYATCNNVFTITGYKGSDPEVNLGGLTPGIDFHNNYYPQTRTFMLGAKVTF